MRRGAKAYLAASLVAQASALVRYVILARTIGPTELGLAATLILTSQFFESISDMGADRFIVQDATGDTPTTQKLVQLAIALRGGLIALALVLGAGFVAHLLHTPSLAPSLVALSLAPLIAGFVNLDLRRAQRTADFRPEALSIILSEVAATAATTIAALHLRDHTAVIYGLVVRSIVQVLVSHLTAKRLYGWAYSREIAARLTQFAGPLVVNGLLVFLGTQGDRVIVGSAVGPAALGQYSAILLLVFYPATAISRFLAGIHMPQVARTRDTEQFAHERDRLAGRSLLVSTALLVGFTVVGPIATPLLYGHRFAQPLPLFAALGFLQATRLLRFWPTTLALGTGDSVTVLVGNVFRIAALPLTLGAYYLAPSIYTIVGGFILGEIAALASALLLLARRQSTEAGADLRRSLLFIAIGALGLTGVAAAQLGNWLVVAPCLVAIVAMLAVMLRTEWAICLEALAMVERQLRRRSRVGSS